MAGRFRARSVSRLWGEATTSGELAPLFFGVTATGCRLTSRWSNQFGRRTRSIKDGLQFFVLNRFIFDQQGGDRFKLVEVLRNDRSRALMRPVDQRPDLLINLIRDFVRVIALLADLAPQEDKFVLFAECEWPEILTHPELGHHPPRNRGRP